MPITGFPDDDDNLFGGRYRIISRLGAGGMGVAYRAWDEEEEVPVVIKIPKKALHPKIAERLARDIHLLLGFEHPHIVPIVNVGEHEGLPYVVMRFLPGGSLSNRRLRDADGKVRPNPPGMLHLWLPAVAEALDFVHARGVVHRDVKPANIFFDAFWGAFLGDCRIARIVEASDSFDRENSPAEPQMCIGALPYMCPEQFTPKPVLDGRTDQYALAVTVYEMVSGTRPFTGTTAHLIVEVTTQPPPRLDRKVRGLPASLVKAVERGLTKSQDERFPTCREFAAAVLCDVEPLADDPGIARLLCPDCGNLLKLPVAAAGLCGLCPKCQAQMKVADDLSWLITADEAKRAMIPFPDRSEVEHFRHFEPFGPFDYGLSIPNGNWAESPRSGLTRVAIAAIIIGTAFLLLATQFVLWRASRHGPLGNEESLNNRRNVLGSVDHRS
jgi:serine/threonine protein kinase